MAPAAAAHLMQLEAALDRARRIHARITCGPTSASTVALLLAADSALSDARRAHDEFAAAVRTAQEAA